MTAVALGALMLLAGPLVAAHTAAQTPQVVSDVDLTRYSGVWHEVARFPNQFQTQCVGDVTAEYALRPDGDITVTNRCRLGDGRIDEAQGVAKKSNKSGTNAKLKVRFAPSWLSFLPAVWGDYWVIALADDYRYALVGSPDHKYLWVLSRAKTMSESDYTAVLARARANGFDVSKLVKTPVSPPASPLQHTVAPF